MVCGVPALLVSSCSSGPPRATKNALAACQTLLDLGYQLNTTRGTVSGVLIQSKLEKAKAYAAAATHENPRLWAQLSKDVGSFVAALEGGTNASKAQLDAVESDCAPFVAPTTSTS